MLLLKALARLLEVLLMLAVAALGIGVGLYCLSGLISLGSARPDRLLHLPVVRRHVGHYLQQIAAPGSTATLALLGGIAAVIIGLALLVGLLGSRRERLIVIDGDDERGGLYARPRTAGQMIRSLTESTPGVTGAKRPRVRLRRSGLRGRVNVRAQRGADPDLETVDDALHERLDPFTESLHLKSNVRVKLVEPRGADVRST
jgi:hypothetical protein